MPHCLQRPAAPGDRLPSATGDARRAQSAPPAACSTYAWRPGRGSPRLHPSTRVRRECVCLWTIGGQLTFHGCPASSGPSRCGRAGGCRAPGCSGFPQCSCPSRRSRSPIPRVRSASWMLRAAAGRGLAQTMITVFPPGGSSGGQCRSNRPLVIWSGAPPGSPRSRPVNAHGSNAFAWTPRGGTGRPRGGGRATAERSPALGLPAPRRSADRVQRTVMPLPATVSPITGWPGTSPTTSRPPEV